MKHLKSTNEQNKLQKKYEYPHNVYCHFTLKENVAVDSYRIHAPDFFTGSWKNTRFSWKLLVIRR